MAIDTSVRSDPLRRRLRRPTLGEQREEAFAFIELFYRENELPLAQMRTRRRQVSHALRTTGAYEHTADELAFGARVAWRNHANCIGRLLWKSLEVYDCRALREPDSIASHLVDHLRWAQGDGRIRSVISIFAPVANQRPPPYVENAQLIQYAGYVQGDGILGDPQNVEFTRTAMSLGWMPPATLGAFDILPIIIRDCDGRRLVYEIPKDAYREIDIVHPSLPGMATLGLRWYTVPVVSDMILTIGGIDYPCAPFNGYYMGTEIASRDLADEARYNLLRSVAVAIGADLADPMWKDQALLELNRAVLHAFHEQGVSIVDHHVASTQYAAFAQTEYAAGRIPSGEWSWIVPPQASSACPVFHLPMTNLHDVPNFYRSRAVDGGLLRVSRETELRGRTRKRLERIRRRIRIWVRSWERW